LAALTGGSLALLFDDMTIKIFWMQLAGLKLLFLLSWAIRLFAIPLLRTVHEPESWPLLKVIRVLRNIRSINTMQGFNPLLHFFISAGGKDNNKKDVGGR
jgi:hypothetical protein